jgi:hypothetical protein
VSAGWAARMQGALAATLANPGWWAIALAAFLVRGGAVLLVLPLFTLPTSASLTTLLAPPLEALILGRPSIEGAVVVAAVVTLVLLVLAALGVAGAWLDLALVREATDDEELELGWAPRRTSPLTALRVRLAAHVPTLLAAGYGAIRLSLATRDELLEPGDPALAMAARILLRAPDALLAVGLAWLVGEAVGALAARRVAAGEPIAGALRRSARHVLGARGLATIVLTTALLLALLVPFVLAIARAWANVRDSLGLGLDQVATSAALLLLVSTWILGLSLLGAVLAFRATAWTVQVGSVPSRAPEGIPDAAREGSPG